jgi:acetylornithine deacetylase/succinyl-diaminopimelate desuccinylase-like protein
MTPAQDKESSADYNRRITTLAADRAVHRAFQWFHLHEPQLRRWQLELLAIPAPPFAESARAAWFLSRFRELELHNPHLDAAGNVLAEFPSSSKLSTLNPKPCILVSAHLDTVFPAGTDTTPREEGAVIHGPGACDNGAGLAALLALAAALRRANIKPAPPLLFAANVGEEGEGDLRGMRQLFSSESEYFQRITTAIAIDAPGNTTVIDRALGSRRLRVTVTGPGGHSWADFGIANPVVALSAAIQALSKLKLPTNPRTTLNVGTISGGTSVNSIPASASAGLDLRSTSALELDRIELAVLKTLESSLKPCKGELRLHVERIGDRPSGALPSSSPLAQTLRAVDRHLSIKTSAHVGSTDANLPLSLNIPALAIGSGGAAGNIHTVHEWFDPTGRDLALRRILLLLLGLCN